MNKLYIFLLRYFLNWFDFFQQKKIISFFKKSFDSELIFIDVGAHFGETVELFNKNLNIKKFHCFEPSKENFKVLKKKLSKKNFFGKIKINNYGLGDTSEQMYLNYTKETSSSTINDLNLNSKYLEKKLNILNIENSEDYFLKEKINIKTLDDYFVKNNLSEIHILKIDTEGYEFKVLNGISKKNFKKINYIVIEKQLDKGLFKNYSFTPIRKKLIENNFKLIKKFKDPIWSYEDHIYENKKFKN